MTKDEALKLALEALEAAPTSWRAPEAITALRQALANEALDRMAENARELGLDYTLTQTNVGIGERAMEAYEAAKQRGWSGVSDERLMKMPDEPVAWESLLGAIARGWCYEKNANKTMDVDLAVAIAKEVDALYTTPPKTAGLLREIAALSANALDDYKMIQSLMAQRKPLTDEQIETIWQNTSPYYDHQDFARDIEAAHGIKE